jgi:hypothetical protein
VKNDVSWRQLREVGRIVEVESAAVKDHLPTLKAGALPFY